MRKTKRFTPKTLDSFERKKRGIGIFAQYNGWHQVTRSDPSSIGLSHIQQLNGRQIDLLSNGEMVCLYFATMLPNLIDLREQFPISLEFSKHELYQYNALVCQDFPGTVNLANELGLKHPMIHGGGKSKHWVMTTDFLLTLNDNGNKKLLAISVKGRNELSVRDLQLQTIEKEYWHKRKVEWLLITPSEFDARVALRLRDSSPWALGQKSHDTEIKTAADLALAMQGQPLLNVISKLSLIFNCQEVAQRAFWQGVWQGMIPLDLRRGWRPYEPIRLLSPSEFQDLNPLVNRRSKWN